MTTALQLFKAACNEACSSKELRGVPVQEILNRLGIDTGQMMRRALAQQFILLMRDAAEGVDVNRPATPLRDLIRSLEARTIEQTKLLQRGENR